MNSVGQLLAGGKSFQELADEEKRERWAVAVRASEDEFSRQRPWKVRLCVMVWSEIVLIGDKNTVDRAAEKRADEAAVISHTAPFASRRWVQKRKEPANPESELEWVEVVFAAIDPMDHESPWAWQLKR